jgi:malate dehydrogenase
MRKVAVIGGGNVGATAAWQLASRDVADVALYDILPGVPAG